MRVQQGVASLEQLAERGLGAAGRQGLVRDGVLRPLHRGVYATTAVDLSLGARCLAACLAAPELVICGKTAAHLLRLRKTSTTDVHGMVLQGHGPTRLDGVVVHRTTELDDERDVTTWSNGMRVLRPPRLCFDLAQSLDDLGLESVVEQMLDRGLCTIPELFDAGRRLKKAGRDGSARFARVLARRPAWAKPKDSDDEVRVLRALADRGIVLVPQFELELPNGSIIHLDGADPGRRFGVEVDHVTWHGGRVSSGYDKWRDRQTDRIGWNVSRVTDEDLALRWSPTISDLVEIWHSRAGL
jgi:very-short-patch-repair endonuclease